MWRAITEPDQLKAWFADHVSGDLVTGGTLTFSHDAAAIPDFRGDVRVVESPRVLEFTWGPDLLRFEIEPTAEGCTLTLLDPLARSAAQQWQGGHAG